MKKLAAFCIVVLVVLLLNPMDSVTSKRYKTGFFGLFDTYTELTVYAADETQAAAIAKLVKNELTECHQLFDIYNAYDGMNNLQTVNQSAGVAPLKVDGRIIALLKLGKEMYALTDGRVNIAMGSVLSLWHEKRTAGVEDPDNAQLPDMAALREAAQHTNIDDLMIDEEAMTVYIADPVMQLDVGAVAKGYATERAAELMMAQGVESALLSVGGNVRAVGAHPDGTPWNVGIQNPNLSEGETNIATVAIDSRSLVTSGNYQRYYIVDGKQYHHIIDPDTLMPAEYVQSVSILAVDSGVADALSTALFTLPVEQGMALIARLKNTEAMWIDINGGIFMSEGFTTE